MIVHKIYNNVYDNVRNQGKLEIYFFSESSISYSRGQIFYPLHDYSQSFRICSNKILENTENDLSLVNEPLGLE